MEGKIKQTKLTVTLIFMACFLLGLCGSNAFAGKLIILGAPLSTAYVYGWGADVIKHKSYRVSALEIEAILQDHSSVINACVIGIPDEKVEERIPL